MKRKSARDGRGSKKKSNNYFGRSIGRGKEHPSLEQSLPGGGPGPRRRVCRRRNVGNNGKLAYEGGPGWWTLTGSPEEGEGLQTLWLDRQGRNPRGGKKRAFMLAAHARAGGACKDDCTANSLTEEKKLTSRAARILSDKNGQMVREVAVVCQKPIEEGGKSGSPLQPRRAKRKEESKDSNDGGEPCPNGGRPGCRSKKGAPNGMPTGKTPHRARVRGRGRTTGGNVEYG